MPMDKDVWGTAVASAVSAIGIQAGTPITNAQLIEVWKAICNAHKTHLTANMTTLTPNAQGGSSALPGTVS